VTRVPGVVFLSASQGRTPTKVSGRTRGARELREGFAHWKCAGEWVAMKRTCFGICLSALALCVLPESAAAAPSGGKVKAYVEESRGVIISTSPNFVTSSSRIHGTLIAHGTSSGTQMAASTPPPCSTGTTSISGSTTAVADKTGDNLYNTYTGTVCVSSSTASSTTYLVTATSTYTGGTGRFAGATGGGTFTATATLYATPQGSQGPFISRGRGTIDLTG
jgi:hypothetical protein